MRAHGRTDEIDERPARDGDGAPARIAGQQKRPLEAQLLRLQQAAGNQAVSAYVQRLAERDPDGPGGAEGVLIPPEDLGAAPSPTSSDGLESDVAAPAGSGIAAPSVAPWASLSYAGDEGLQAIAAPSVVPLATLQAPGGGNPWRLGWTSLPVNRKAPQFEFNTTEFTPPVGPPSYASTPTFKQHAYEGDSVCWYLGPGLHKSSNVSGGKPVYFDFSPAISARDGAAEGEHSSDFKHARDISINEAENVLATHIVGKTFPAAGTKENAEKYVLDTITAKLTHPALGNDQTQWDAKYVALYMKSAQRDVSWHSFGTDSRSTNAAGDVILKVGNGTTSIGTTTSPTLIVY